ncbi:hypothetical protein A5882_003651 [Enterococcus sp. 4E1_DIV0656]|uniref:hypothetical protein n=1 Tax=Enterococcus sp. 4E1_DIV0656 TaxID=1834180 RepID=UPI000A3D207E|nr:hypothetical protein [Enterococcus sp. 4E1_DIV0656]OTO09318.1 hypothetical protein A5882_003651 [Enterococcus sp. 4E1_DIV0656]
MAGYRSENGKFTNKQNYKDLSMTLYPNNLDSRDSNKNMKGHVNVGEGEVPDFVMAEYLNSLYDAVMSIQRALGVTPMVYTGATNTATIIENSSVSERIGRVENGLFDERYGGAGWVNNESRPTLKKHSHTGTNGQPPKISLTQEISGLLPKSNLNLTQSDTGLLASDIKLSKTDATTITNSLADKLSKSKGGVVKAALEAEGSFNSRYSREFSTDNMAINANCSQVSAPTLTGKVTKSHETLLSTLLNSSLNNVHLGKYVANIRFKVDKSSNLPITTPILRCRIGSSQAQQILANETVDGVYRNYYFVFDHTIKEESLIIEKLATTQSAAISIDNVLVQPMHPSVLDR